MEPLRRPTKAGVSFQWGPVRNKKHLESSRLYKNAVTSYYNPKKQLYITADLSPVSVIAILASTLADLRQTLRCMIAG